jgi:organic radical activating enzyme
VDLEWLEANPGKLFHTDTMINDRRSMIANKSCASCYYGCYKYEERGETSARQLNKNKNKDKIVDVYAPLMELQISLTSDCNLSCVYCSPEWSTAWQRDIEKNGDYVLEGQVLKNNNWSKLWSNMKQKSRGTGSKFFSLLLREIKLADQLKKITLLGGEPLLNNQFDKLIDVIDELKINVVTGLGVTDERLEKILQKIQRKNVMFEISAEATGKFFEFIRHGLEWKDFQKRVCMIENKKHSIGFSSTISNLSVFDFHNFYEQYGKKFPINLNTITGRPFLSPHVLDEKSKEQSYKRFSKLGSHADKLLKMIEPNPTDIDRYNLGKYLKLLSDRRLIQLDFLPKHLRDWCASDT